MICEMDYERITIKELTKRARINRKTFYLHYNCLDDLLRELQSELAQSFIKRTQKLKRPNDLDKITREFFLVCEEGGRFYEQLLCRDSYSVISNEVTENIMKETWSLSENKAEIKHPIQNIIISFVSRSTIEIYKQWIADGKQIPLEQIIELTSKLVCNGINGLNSIFN